MPPVPASCVTAPEAASSLTVPPSPVVPALEPAPPDAVIALPTVILPPPAVSVILPAAPPLVSPIVAALPEVVILPLLLVAILPSEPTLVAVRTTSPPTVAATLDVVFIASVMLILGAESSKRAPFVVIPVGLTEPMVSASELCTFTAPVAEEANVPNWLVELLSVKLPVPSRPSLAEIISPFCVTVPDAAESTVLANVLTEATPK